MFVRRKEFYKLQQELYKLKQHVGRLTTETEKNTNYGKRNSKAIDRIEEEVGINSGYLGFFMSPFSDDHELKAFNLKEKVDAIMRHLGLVESATQSNKLIPAPKKKKGTK